MSGIHQRRPDAFNMMSQDESQDETRGGTFGGMRPRYDDNASADNDNELTTLNDFSDHRENVSAWLQKPVVMQFVRRKFSQFLRNYTDENEQHVYGNRIQEMCQLNKQSIEVNFVHISNKQPTLAIWLAEEPA